MFLIQLLKSLKSLDKCDSIIFTELSSESRIKIFHRSSIDRSIVILPFDELKNKNPSNHDIPFRLLSTFFPTRTHVLRGGGGNRGGDNLHFFMFHGAGRGQQQSGNLLKTSTIRDPEILTRNRSRNRDVSRRKWPHLHAAWMCVVVDRFWLTGRGGEKKKEKKKNVQITARKKDEGKGGRRGREGGDGDLKTWLERVFLGNWW